MNKPLHNINDDQKVVRIEQRSPVQNDEQLWESFRKGKESAFVQIYNQHFRILYNYGYQLSGNSDLIKDCIQEIFIQIRKKRSKLPKVTSIKAYLLHCVRNKLITELKKLKKNEQVDIDSIPLNFNTTPSHENVLINRQLNDNQIKKVHESIVTIV